MIDKFPILQLGGREAVVLFAIVHAWVLHVYVTLQNNTSE